MYPNLIKESSLFVNVERLQRHLIRFGNGNTNQSHWLGAEVKDLCKIVSWWQYIKAAARL